MFDFSLNIDYTVDLGGQTAMTTPNIYRGEKISV